MLRYTSDIKTLIYLVVTSMLMCGLFLYHDILSSSLFVAIYIAELTMFVSVGVIVHNHRHVQIWKNKTLNTITDCWLSVLYGYPVFGWIPTHMQNHHIHTNREQDYTKTYAFSEKNTLWTLLYYPAYSGTVQQKAINKYMKTLYHKDNRKFWLYMLQIFSLVSFLIVAFVINWKNALLFIVIPQQIALNSVLVFNYLQHIHADEESDYNHSRNFEGILNVFLFNNGLHTAHHIKPHLHWSKVPELHKEIRDKIDPSLIEQSLFWYLVRQYIIAPFYQKWASKSPRSLRNIKT